MTDEQARTLERHARLTGAPDDEVAALLARVRAGDEVAALQWRVHVGELSRARLEIAAWCAHPLALAATGLEAPDPRMSYGVWLSRVPHGRRVVAWRAVLAALDLVPSASHRPLDEGPGGPTHVELVRWLEAWLLSLGARVDVADGANDFAPGWTSGEPPFYMHTFGFLLDAGGLVGDAQVQERVRGELIAWALGSDDPVRERATRAKASR